jgi:hypothetical protein
MRVITQKAIDAFRSGDSFKSGNTEVNKFGYFLHGNKIAYKDENALYISLCGWNTNTTRERLNGLQGVKINTRQGQAYLNGKEWNGEYIKVI